MNALSLKLPNSIHRHVKEIAIKKGISKNQFISSAISEKLSAMSTENYIIQRAKRANKGDFKKILDHVPNRTPLAGDEL